MTDATGVSGSAPDGRARGTPSPRPPWPAVAIVGGVLLVLAGIAVLVTGTRWPASSRRYRAARLADADDVAGHDAGGERAASDRAIDDWDELSRGDDPTDDQPTTSEADAKPSEPNR